MSKPDVMWLSARIALVFHRGRIWSMSQEDESTAWVVHVGAGFRGDVVSHFGKLVARFPGGYHAALDWLQKGDFGMPDATPANPEMKNGKRKMKN